MSRKSNVCLCIERSPRCREIEWDFDSKNLKIHAHVNISYVFMSAAWEFHSRSSMVKEKKAA